MTLPPWERYLNWVPDIAPPPSRDHCKDPPTPSRDYDKENLPPHEEPRNFPRKIRPRRRQEKHHVPSSSQPGPSRSPGSAMRAPVKHPLTSQRPQHPQPPSPAANHNSSRAYLPDHHASSRIQPLDLVETPSPDLASPHQLFSDLVETPSLDRPLGSKQKSTID